jgi:hypothetical protein
MAVGDDRYAKARGARREIKSSDEFGLKEIRLADGLVPLKRNWRL